MRTASGELSIAQYRILVLTGAGHAKLLREFLSEVPGLQVMECLQFLN
jgi:hypothetical protein